MPLVKCRECGAEMSGAAKACPKCGAPGKKKTSVLTWIVGGIALLIVLSSIINQSGSGVDQSSASAGSGLQSQKPPVSARVSAVATCRSEIEGRRAAYAKLMEAGKYWDAARAIGGCYNLLDDPALVKMVGLAEVKAHVQTATDAKKPAAERVKAIEMLTRDYPEEGKQFVKLLPDLQAKADQAARAADKKQAQAEAARRKKEGVILGMSREDVLASSWGRPEKVNRSHGAWGEHEQWVYPGNHNYLYFENGKLTSIQN